MVAQVEVEVVESDFGVMLVEVQQAMLVVQAVELLVDLVDLGQLVVMVEFVVVVYLVFVFVFAAVFADVVV